MKILFSWLVLIVSITLLVSCSEDAEEFAATATATTDNDTTVTATTDRIQQHLLLQNSQQ